MFRDIQRSSAGFRHIISGCIDRLRRKRANIDRGTNNMAGPSNDSPTEIVSKLLDMFRPIIDDFSKLKWALSDGFWLLTCRCVLRRQFDALEVIVDLARRNSGHCAVPLLRPACEEFLWTKYLRSLTPAVRETIVLQKSQIETADALDAQRQSIGDTTMNSLGFTSTFMNSMRENRTRAQRQLTSIKKLLKWPRKPEFLPSVSFIARETNEKELYDLIYHATSRTVHFTVSELLRRAWGDPEEVHISSLQMDDYWSRFSLYWGGRIFFFAFVDISEALVTEGIDVPNFQDDSLFESVMRQFAEPGVVPIITPQELNLHISKDLHDTYIGRGKHR
jgi:Family of unknown function (DUF5677)